MDGKPTAAEPHPTLFRHNNFKRPQVERPTATIVIDKLHDHGHKRSASPLTPLPQNQTAPPAKYVQGQRVKLTKLETFTGAVARYEQVSSSSAGQNKTQSSSAGFQEGTLGRYNKFHSKLNLMMTIREKLFRPTVVLTKTKVKVN